MKSLRKFEEFVRTGIVNKRSPDFNRARSLVNEAENRKRFLDEMVEKMGITDKNANYFIENSYDILIELIRAKMLLDGFHASGKGAHEAEVSYTRLIGLNETETRFINDLRFFRNGILYYGKDFDSNYAKKVLKFVNNIFPVLRKSLKK